MPRKSPYTIKLSPSQKSRLQAIVGKYTSPYMDVVRAKIILFAAEGMTNDQIGRKLGTSRQIVSKWRKRFFNKGLDGLNGLPRSGRPSNHSPQVPETPAT
ncbi:MAG: helix-turn-helix domain-containing protein, partial [Pseudomonadota bacterium]